MNYQEMSVRELKSYRREVQEDELWAAQDANDQAKIDAAQEKLSEIDRVMKAKLDANLFRQ